MFLPLWDHNGDSSRTSGVLVRSVSRHHHRELQVNSTVYFRPCPGTPSPSHRGTRPCRIVFLPIGSTESATRHLRPPSIDSSGRHWQAICCQSSDLEAPLTARVK